MFTLRDGLDPVYRRLADSIKQAIDEGLFQPGDQLPTVRMVAVQLVLNPNTVARAYQVLEQDGVIETAVGRGSFVASRREAGEQLKAAVVAAMTELHRAGWTVAELRAWCLAVLQDLDGEGD